MDIEAFPWLFPPADAKVIDPNKAATLAGGVPSLVVLESLRGLQGYRGVIRHTDIFSSDFGSVAVPHSYFSIYKDGQPIPEYVRITMPLVPTIPVLIFLEPNQTLELKAINLTANPIAVRYRLTGWYWRTT